MGYMPNKTQHLTNFTELHKAEKKTGTYGQLHYGASFLVLVTTYKSSARFNKNMNPL